MESFAGWAFFVLLIIVNTVVYMLIDAYFTGEISALRDEEDITYWKED
jgi:hypothetical protein